MHSVGAMPCSRGQPNTVLLLLCCALLLAPLAPAAAPSAGSSASGYEAKVVACKHKTSDIKHHFDGGTGTPYEGFGRFMQHWGGNLIQAHDSVRMRLSGDSDPLNIWRPYS